MSLKYKFIKGIIWTIISKVSLKLINFIIMVILARLLEPTDFGIFAIAFAIINLLEVTRDFGIESVLIHYNDKKYELNVVYNTAFYMYLVTAFLLYIISYQTAPFIASFFENKSITTVLRVLLLTIVIWSFGALPRTILVKDLDFQKMFKPQIIPKILYGISSILLAYTGYGIWSLVIGRITLELTSAIFYWKSIEWRPMLVFNKEKAMFLVTSGKYIFISGIIGFVLSSIDIVWIGKLFTENYLGYYSISMSIAGIFTMQSALVLSQVTFPTYAKVQSNLCKMRNYHLKIIKYYSMFLIPTTFGLIIVANNFVEVIYGDKWLPVVPILQILCMHGLFSSYKKVSTSVFLAIGKMKNVTNIDYLQLIATGLLIYPLTIHYGIIGTSIAVTTAAFISMLYAFITVSITFNRPIEATTNEILISMKGFFLPGILMYAVQEHFSYLHSKITLALTVSIGIFAYLAYLIMNYRKKIGKINIIEMMQSYSET